MNRLLKLALIIISFSLVLSSCKKTESRQEANNGTFKITKINGSTYTTSYVNTPIPTQNGTFSLQYSKPTPGGSNLYKMQFFVLIDGNNDADLDVILPSVFQNGVTYTTNTSQNRTVDIGLFLNNTTVQISRSEVIFESSIYPGRIKGTCKGFNSSGALVCIGEFDFIAQ